MYARLVRFSLGPGKHAAAQAIADNLAPLITSQPGNEGVTVFGDEADGEYGLFVLWNSQESANAAATVMTPKLNQHLAGNIQGPLNVHLYKVFSK
jgi:heme-degrading monooxygenase HmoA